MITEHYSENNCLAAPGLAINAAGSATVKYANTFTFKANGFISTSITTAIATSLSLATLQSPFPNGSASTAGVLASGSYRIYTLVGTLPASSAGAAAPTFSWLASPDYTIGTSFPNLGNAADPNQSNQAPIGWVVIQNNTGSNFTPGTTALDTAGLTVTYFDNFRVAGV